MTTPAPADPLRAWLTATDGPATAADGATAASPAPPQPRPPAGRLRVLVPAAAAVVVAVVVLTVRTLPAPATTAVAPPPQALPAPAVTPLDDQAPAVAAAITAARLTTPDDVYLDLAVAEQVHWHGPVAVVVVRGIALHRQGDRWTDPTDVRYGVAVRAEPPQVVGGPWHLPPHPAADPVSWADEPRADPKGLAAVVSALGYRDIGTVRLRRAEGLDGVTSAAFVAVAPGEQRAREHEVWLNTDGSRVLGAPATPQTSIPVEE